MGVGDGDIRFLFRILLVVTSPEYTPDGLSDSVIGGPGVRSAGNIDRGIRVGGVGVFGI